MTKEEKDKLLDLMGKELNDYIHHITNEEARLKGKVEGAEYILRRLIDCLRGEEDENDT